MIAPIKIPSGIAFSDLCLSRLSDRSVSFDMGVVSRVCTANGIDEKFLQEDGIAGLLVGWYIFHRQQGGMIDTTAEDLFSEVIAEERAGQAYSLKPGQA